MGLKEALIIVNFGPENNDGRTLKYMYERVKFCTKCKIFRSHIDILWFIVRLVALCNSQRDYR